MTQKTNQFNLTTKRYTEKDIYKFVKSESHLVYSFSVTDKFGDSGLTGLCIVKVDSNTKTAEIDTFSDELPNNRKKPRICIYGLLNFRH